MCSCRSSRKNGVVFVVAGQLDRGSGRRGSAEYFEREVEPVLSPLALDPARPFPKVLNKSLNFAIVVEGEDGFGRNSGLAVVQAPRSLPRLIRLPDELGSRHFVFLGTIVEAFVSKLFDGHARARLLSVPRHAQQRSVRRAGGGRRPAARGAKASSPRAATAMRCGWRRAHDCPEEILELSARAIRAHRATICTRCRVR